MVSPGTPDARSFMLATLNSSRDWPVTTLMVIGMSCTFSTRFCAVTMTSSSTGSCARDGLAQARRAASTMAAAVPGRKPDTVSLSAVMLLLSPGRLCWCRCSATCGGTLMLRVMRFFAAASLAKCSRIVKGGPVAGKGGTCALRRCHP